MRRASLLLIVVAALACAEKEKPKPVSEPGEKLYTVRGTILGRRATDNTVNMDHEAIPGFMTAMVMDYQVRGADVASLPPDRSRIEARLHVTDRAYWITDVKTIP
jgi:protein SCO1/2